METTGSLLAVLMQIILYSALLITTVYSLIYAYHWFTYGTSKKISTISLLVFLTGAGGILLIMLFGLLNV